MRSTILSLFVALALVCPVGDGVSVPTLEAHEALEARVTAIEELLTAPPVEPPVVRPPVEPPVVRPPVVRPPVVKPPTIDPEGWPSSTPSITASIKFRNSRNFVHVDFGLAGPWSEREGGMRRFQRSLVNVPLPNGKTVTFGVWVEQVNGIDGTRVTLQMRNDRAHAGVIEFRGLRLMVDGTQVGDPIGGQNVMIPRGSLIRRVCVGVEANRLASWDYLPTLAHPSWAPSQFDMDTDKHMEGPYLGDSGVLVDLGPYKFYWPDRNLSNSHGGQGVAPFHGGVQDWAQFPEGYRNRECLMLLEFQRPIWHGEEDPNVPYWMGRTSAHRLPGFTDNVRPGWCGYANTLQPYQFSDLTHLSRSYAGAAAIAQWDIFAEDCMLAVWHDYTMASSLTREVEQSNNLLWPLWYKAEVGNGPDSTGEGNRGLGHRLRLVRSMEGIAPQAEWEAQRDRLVSWVLSISDMYGNTSSWNEDKSWWAPVEAPNTYTFHCQLVQYELSQMPGLKENGMLLRQFLGAYPPVAFERRDGPSSDTVEDRVSPADGGSAHLPYSNMVMDELISHDSPVQFLIDMEGRGVNGSSQDLDCTPRHLWESAAGF